VRVTPVFVVNGSVGSIGNMFLTFGEAESLARNEQVRAEGTSSTLKAKLVEVSPVFDACGVPSGMEHSGRSLSPQCQLSSPCQHVCIHWSKDPNSATIDHPLSAGQDGLPETEYLTEPHMHPPVRPILVAMLLDVVDVRGV